MLFINYLSRDIASHACRGLQSFRTIMLARFYRGWRLYYISLYGQCFYSANVEKLVNRKLEKRYEKKMVKFLNISFPIDFATVNTKYNGRGLKKYYQKLRRLVLYFKNPVITKYKQFFKRLLFI